MTPDPPRSAAGPPARKQERHTCGGCDTTWTGLGRAHCSACHRTFSTTSWFDRHRDQRGPRGTCLDPATLDGLVLQDGIWRGTPMAPEVIARRWGPQ
jgi:hypothetical protein